MSNPKNFGLRVAGIIFSAGAFIHLLRIITGVPVFIAGWLLPMWVNYAGFFLTELLGLWLLLLSTSRDY